MERSLCIFGDSLFLWLPESEAFRDQPCLNQSCSILPTVLESACVFALGVVVSQSSALWISTQSSPLPSPFSYWALPLMHPSLGWLPSSCTTKTCPLTTCESHYQFPYSLMVHILTRWALSGGDKRVIAACRWRACGSCWLWRLLYARGWMRRRIGARLWPCYSETLAPSHWHTLVWRELDCGHPALDLHRLQPLALRKAGTH